MRNCPFCGEKPKFAFPTLMYLEEEKLWSFHHCCHASKISVLLCGDTVEEIKANWNGDGHAEEQTSESV